MAMNGKVTDAAKTVTTSPEAPVATVVTEPVETKSSKIKELYDAGVAVGEIAKQMGIRYAFAYQVSQRHAAATGKVFSTGREQGPTIASEIRKLSDEGMAVGDIAKKLNKNYTFCWTTVSAHKKALAKSAAAAGVTEAKAV